MPTQTLEGKQVRIACNQSADGPLLDVLTGNRMVLWRGARAYIQGAFFSETPSATSFITDLVDVTNIRLIVRKYNYRGDVLIDKTVTDTDAFITYSDWLTLEGQQFTFELTEVETNQVVPSSGTLPIFFAIEVSNSSKTFIGAWGYGELTDVGITDVGTPPDVVNESEFGFVNLTAGQGRVDVVFHYEKSSSDYVFEYCYIEDPNTVPEAIDAVVNVKSTTGFTLQLSGTPTTNLSILRWSVRTLDSGRAGAFGPSAPIYVLEGMGIGRNSFFASRIATLDSNVRTGGGTNATLKLQAELNLLGAAGGGWCILDGAALTSAMLFIDDNITIFCPSKACGIFLASGSNCYMVGNRLGIVTNLPPPRPSTYNKNIKISGGTWNGNYDGQSGLVANTSNNMLTCGFAFAGVDELILESLTILNARRFASLLAYLKNPYSRNITCEWDAFHVGNNNDGLHFWGPIEGTNSIHDIKGINCCDDLIALNYVEAPYFTGDLHLFDTLPAAVNTLVDGVSTSNGAGPFVLHGSTLDYPGMADIATSVGNVTALNFGSAMNSTLATGFTLFASGRWDRLIVDYYTMLNAATMPNLGAPYDRNVRLIMQNPNSRTIFNNWDVSGATDDTQPFILVSGNATMHSLTLNKCRVSRTLDTPTNSLVYFSSGTDASIHAINEFSVVGCDLTGFDSILFNGRPSNKFDRFTYDNNITNGAALLGSGGIAPANIRNGIFNIDGTTGNPLVPFLTECLTDIRPSGTPARVLLHQWRTPNFADAYGMLWQLVLAGSNNSTQSVFVLSSGNNQSGSYTVTDLLSWMTGAGMLLGTGLPVPPAGQLALSGGLVGVPTNSSAPAGCVGEVIAGACASGSAVALTTNIFANIAFIDLTPGDWLVFGAHITFILQTGATLVTNLVACTNYVSVTLGVEGTYKNWGKVDNAGPFYDLDAPIQRFGVASGTLRVYLIARGTFTGGTLSAFGTINALRFH